MLNCKTSARTAAQQSSKRSLLFRPAALAAILLLAAVFSSCKIESDVSVVGTTYGPYEIIQLDSCEYVVFREAYKGGICHKGNCKFCAARHSR